MEGVTSKLGNTNRSNLRNKEETSAEDNVGSKSGRQTQNRDSICLQRPINDPTELLAKSRVDLVEKLEMRFVNVSGFFSIDCHILCFRGNEFIWVELNVTEF